MITCRRAAEWTSREVDAPLSAGRRFALGLHRFLCPKCRRFATQLAEVDLAVGETIRAAELGSTPLTDEARERMRRALREEQTG